MNMKNRDLLLQGRAGRAGSWFQPLSHGALLFSYLTELLVFTWAHLLLLNSFLKQLSTADVLDSRKMSLHSGVVLQQKLNCKHGKTLSLCLMSRCFQAQVLVCRALSNVLLLPWPNLPESEQQWAVRSTNHASLISALTREYRQLKSNAILPQRKVQLEDSKYQVSWCVLSSDSCSAKLISPIIILAEKLYLAYGEDRKGAICIFFLFFRAPSSVGV